ncbi:repetitive organellar protein-like isoform X1 [Physella acuta]|uniref:repetitive organellar protein-like isoform X1 n=1 Tax=Physella acuta TaxID=109671 RepID=UPI0027DD72DB|nr:repetitive organellar protein-like isoform X1 [Physella acuta]
MRPRIQLKIVTVQMKYLQFMEPVIGLMKNVLEKSKTWIEDTNDNPSITYIELCQELASATTALLDVASNILSENKEPVVVDGRTPSLAQSTLHTTATEKRSPSELTYQVTKLSQQSAEVFTRLGLLENRISCLQGTTQKTKESISERKQRRDNFVTEQSDMGVNLEQLTKKQKQNFKNIRKQMSEQDNKIKEMNKDIESLKEKETRSNKTLEKLTLEIKEFENNLQKINIEMQANADGRDGMKEEIKSHSDLIVSLQHENNKILEKTSNVIEQLQSKHSVMYKLLQQRLMPIEKLIQIFNQNLETREKRKKMLGELENTISKFCSVFHLIESRVCNRYACHVQLAGPTPVRAGSIISRFSEVREYNGQHFNQTTGTFVSPHDGLFLVCVNLNESKDKQILVSVMAGGVWCRFIDVKSSVVVDMKKGQELYFQVFLADQGSTLSCYSSFNIVSL